MYFQSLDLVDIPWSVLKLGRTNMVSTYHVYRFKYSIPSFGFCAQVAWMYAHIEYMHPEQHPKFSLYFIPYIYSVSFSLIPKLKLST